MRVNPGIAPVQLIEAKARHQAYRSVHRCQCGRSLGAKLWDTLCLPIDHTGAVPKELCGGLSRHTPTPLDESSTDDPANATIRTLSSGMGPAQTIRTVLTAGVDPGAADQSSLALFA